jgi:hypothetical protein
MWRLTSVKALPGYRLEVAFEDGVRGVVDCSEDLWGPVFEPLRDPERFAEVTIDEFGAPSWPNGADLAPDAIHDRLVAAHAAR